MKLDKRLGAMARHVPILDWGRQYTPDQLSADLLAAIIVTIMLIPQSLAYALLAGLPAEMGLYASILPLVAYAIFGTSRALAVGPVAVVSLMTAAAIGNLGLTAPAAITMAAITLAFLSGVILLAMGVFRLGFLANFLSHPVIAGFITASGLLIAASQLKHILGITANGHSLTAILGSLLSHLGETNPTTFLIGGGTLGFLYWVRNGFKPLLLSLGTPARVADILTKAGPVGAVGMTIWISWQFDLQAQGVAIVGSVPQGLPPLSVPSFDLTLWRELIGAAVLISIIGFVESVSVAQTLAAKKRQRIQPDQELVGLGASNIAAAMSGGYPVTGGFARSVVNFDAGAETPAAGAFTAIGIALAALFLTPFLYYLPKATLSATIIVAVMGLVDLGILRDTWRYHRADFTAVLATILLTLGYGVEIGVSAGVALSIVLYLYKTSRPHIAEVGLLPGTQHFRNIDRHAVWTHPALVTLRLDENLYFANTRYIEDYLLDRISRGGVKHVVLMCSAVNEIDLSALETLEALNRQLKEAGISLNLSEVKGPVMDRLRRTEFLDHLSGEVFLTQYMAMQTLGPVGHGRIGNGSGDAA